MAFIRRCISSLVVPFVASMLLLVSLTACMGTSAGAGRDLPPDAGEADRANVRTDRRNVRPIVIAHRGASGYLPEHTLGGYELAVRLGADYIEPDLQLTSDGQLVAMHDSTLTRTTDVASVFPGRPSYEVSAFTLAEVRRLTVRPVGATEKAAYPGFTPSSADPWRVPTFQQVIDLARGLRSGDRTIGLYPEAKQADPLMEDAILSTLTANGYRGSDAVFIQSFSVETVRSLRDKQTKSGTDFRLMLLSSSADTLTASGLDRIAGFATGVGVSIASPGLNRSFIEQAHAAGLLVHAYTFAKSGPTGAAEYHRFFEMGIDGVFSNFADLAVAVRDNRQTKR